MTSCSKVLLRRGGHYQRGELVYTCLWLDGEQIDLGKSKFSGFHAPVVCARGVLTREFFGENVQRKKILEVTFFPPQTYIPPIGPPAHHFGAAEFLAWFSSVAASISIRIMKMSLAGIKR